MSSGILKFILIKCLTEKLIFSKSQNLTINFAAVSENTSQLICLQIFIIHSVLLLKDFMGWAKIAQ